MRFGRPLEIRSGGIRWAIARAHDLGPADNAHHVSGSFAASMVDEWCGDATNWPDVFELYEELVGPSYRPPTNTDINEWIKPRLRRAFEDGTLIAVDASLLGQATKTPTEQGVHGQQTKVEPPLPPPAPRRPVTPPKALHSFAIRLVDELGTAISGVGLQFSHGGSQDDATTDGNGVARVEDSAATSAKAKIVDTKALRKALKPVWDQPRGERKWLDESNGVTVAAMKDPLPQFDLAADKLRIVSIQPYVARVRLIGGFFDTDKSFVLPAGLEGVRGIVKMYDELPKSKLLAVGHTDTAGKSDYNDKLSVERAEALKDYLSDNVDGWLKWYGSGVSAEKRWGAGEDENMIEALPDSSERDGSEPAVRWFQRTRGLKVDGVAGPETRQALVKEYMALDGTSLPKGIEVIAHGCGENFPMDATPDDVADPDNRRVEVFFFDGVLGVQPTPRSKNSKPNSVEYPEWVKRAKRTADHKADTTFPFQYGVPWKIDDPWSAGARLRIMSADGSQTRIFTRDEGKVVDEYRVFIFRDAVPGIRYRGTMLEGSVEYELFGPVELVKIQAPSEDPNQLPLPDAPPQEEGHAAEEMPVPEVAAPLDPAMQDDEIDLVAVETAAGPLTSPSMPPV